MRAAISLILLLSCFMQTGCFGNLLTAANVVYDRHNLYKKISDFQLSTNVTHVLHANEGCKLPHCKIEVATLNGDLLLVGRVANVALREDIQQRIEKMGGYRRFFNQIEIRTSQENELQDSLITGKIRSDILGDSSIDPHPFKVVTSHQIVYLMGDVDPAQSQQVIQYARSCAGVKRVVKLFKYYRLTSD